MTDALIRTLHFISILSLAASLAVQNVLLRPRMTGAELRRLAAFDAVYGASAVGALVGGLLLWLSVGKPSAFYMANPLFHTKFTLFGVVVVMSLFTTVFLLKNRKTDQTDVEIPKRLRTLKRLELILLAVMPVLATLMARGIGAS